MPTQDPRSWEEILASAPDDIPLVGVYSTVSGEILLMPCIKERVWLITKADDRSQFTHGYTLNKALAADTEISSEKIAEYNNANCLPRLVSKNQQELVDEQYISSHQYLLEIYGKSNDSRKYRGFSVTKTADATLKFEWKSSALNSPRDLDGRIIRNNDISMREEDQKTIINKIGTALHLQLDVESHIVKKPLDRPPPAPRNKTRARSIFAGENEENNDSNKSCFPRKLSP